MYGKRGQGALEFLMTYGWALAVLLVSLGSLVFYFGFDSNSFASETCFLGPGLGCSDMVVHEDSITVSVRNSLGKDMTSFSVASDSCTVASDNPRVDNGDEVLLTMSGCSFTAGDLIEESLDVSYTFLDSNLDHVKDASLTGVVEGGASQSFGGGSGGNGYNPDGNTIGLYKFDEGDGSIILDDSSNSLDGTFFTLGELVDNGGAETGTMDNFVGFQGIRSSNCNTGSYCFYRNGDLENVQSVEFIEIDMAKSYTLSGEFKSTGVGDSLLYFGYVPFDEDQVQIKSEEVYTRLGTETELYDDISPTDKIIRIKDGTNWIAYTHDRVAFNVDDSGQYNDLPNRELSNNNIIRVTNMQPLPYWEVEFNTNVGVSYAKDTKIREHTGAGTYIYDGAMNENVPFSWTKYGGVTSGESLRNTDPGKWWRGTKYAKIVFLLNHQQSGSYSLDIDDVSVVSEPVTYSNKWVPGKYGTTVELNGIDDYVEIPHSPVLDFEDELSLEFWFYPYDINLPNQRLVHRSGIWGTYISQGTLYFYVDTQDSGVPGSGWRSVEYTLPASKRWYHLAASYGGGKMVLYIDGVEVGNSPVSQAGVIDKDIRSIYAGSGNGADQFFGGLIDEIRVSDYSRYTV